MKQLFVYSSIMLAVNLCACSVLKTSIVPKAAAIVNAYCLEPQEERLLIREQVATATSPNRIEIHCKGDSDLPNQEP